MRGRKRGRPNILEGRKGGTGKKKIRKRKNHKRKKKDRTNILGGRT
jgi:hypothetical protein